MIDARHRARRAVGVAFATVLALGVLTASDALVSVGDQRSFFEGGFAAAPAHSYAASSPEVPQRIAIPVLSVYAPIVEVGKDASGGVAVPDDIATIGWYRGSEEIGARRGTTVLVGHRDGHDVGAGAFFGLDQLARGDRVLVSGGGAATTYTVTDVMLVEKTDFAKVSAEVFSSTGDPRLILVSCGGAFDFDIGSYESNVIVTAYPESNP